MPWDPMQSGNAGPCGFSEEDKRPAPFAGEGAYEVDLFHVGQRAGSAHDGHIIGNHADRSSLNLPVTDDLAVCRRVFFHARKGGMSEQAKFEKGAWVKEVIQPFPGIELALCFACFELLGSAHGQMALRFFMKTLHFLSVVHGDHPL